MEDFSSRVLARVRPESFDGDQSTWQRQKSAQMREDILEATIDCLVTDGYSGLSIQRVSDAAGVSKGAMHHHFATKIDLVAAVIEYTFYRRMEHFLADIAKMATDRDFIADATELHWRSVETREYAAYLELAVAARTDEELNAHFLPASRRFDKVWREEMIIAFPRWKERLPQLLLANDFAIAMHMGMLMMKPVFRNGERMKALHKLTLQVIKQIHSE